MIRRPVITNGDVGRNLGNSIFDNLIQKIKIKEK